MTPLTASPIPLGEVRPGYSGGRPEGIALSGASGSEFPAGAPTCEESGRGGASGKARPGFKFCSRCRLELADSLFHARRDRPAGSGRRSVCKMCKARWRKVYNDRTRFGGMRAKVLERDGHRCAVCGLTQEEHLELYSAELTVDHINGEGRYHDKPDNRESNLVTLCFHCHGEKDAARQHGRNWPKMMSIRRRMRERES